MSETAPLLHDGLPRPNRAGESDHPIFLRVCHSAWKRIDQAKLVWIRGFVLAYLIAATGILIHFKTSDKHNHASSVDKEKDHSQWIWLFEFSTLVWVLTLVYHTLAFSWTLTHLHWPEVDLNDTRWESVVLRAMQPPEQTATSRRRFYFSLFYVLVNVFSFMLATIYWTVLVPNGQGNLPGDQVPKLGDDFLKELFADGWFKPFELFNVFLYPSFLSSFEIFFLNAIKRPKPVLGHFFATQFFAGLYLGWAAIGKLLTGDDAFFWFDPDKVGGCEVVTLFSAGFIGLSGAAFAWFYGLTGMREAMTEKEKKPNSSDDGAVASQSQHTHRGYTRHNGGR